MPENITAIVLKVVIAIRVTNTRVKLDIPVPACFCNMRLLGSPSIGMDFVPCLL